MQTQHKVNKKRKKRSPVHGCNRFSGQAFVSRRQKINTRISFRGKYVMIVVQYSCEQADVR